MNHRPVCVKCRVEFRPERNGVKVIDLFINNSQPYKIWDADMWKCPSCEVEIIVGFGRAPLYEHFQEGFGEFFSALKDKIEVKGE